MDTWASTGRSTYELPGVPSCCSTKKQTALAASAHEPPPKDTMPSTPSAWAWLTADCTALAGTWERTPAKVETSTRLSPSTRRRPASEASRPSVVTSITRRALTSFTTSATRSSAPAPK